jgi:hypothetical protein
VTTHPSRLASALGGAAIALTGVAAGAFLFSGHHQPVALAAQDNDARGDIPALILDPDKPALVVARSGIFFVIDQNGNALPIRVEDSALRNVPGTEFLRAW